MPDNEEYTRVRDMVLSAKKGTTLLKVMDILRRTRDFSKSQREALISTLADQVKIPDHQLTALYETLNHDRLTVEIKQIAPVDVYKVLKKWMDDGRPMDEWITQASREIAALTRADLHSTVTPTQ